MKGCSLSLNVDGDEPLEESSEYDKEGGGWEESGGEERIDCGRRSDGDRPESVRILDISTASILPQPSKRELD